MADENFPERYLSHPRFMILSMNDLVSLTISCDDCAMQESDVCADCVVTFLCNREPGDAIVIDAAEARAVRLLAGAGLVPELRHRRPAS